MGLRRKPATASDATRAATYPHPYPDGWYRLAGSDSLRSGQIRFIACLGRHFAVWRSEHGGDAHAMQAFCPHLGANLAHGRVRGACIECPFHGWRFTGDGHVDSIAYCEHAPKGALAETFPVRETYGQILLYFRNGGKPGSVHDAVPYEPPRIPEVDDGTFVLRGNHDSGHVPLHIIEFAENAADSAHFARLHDQMRIPWTRIRVPGVTLEHETDWKVDEERYWRMYFLDRTTLRILGRRVRRWRGSARITYTGPASLVNFRFAIPGRGEIEMIQTHLPLSPLKQQVNFRWFASRGMSRIIVWYVVGNWISQWRRDVDIWSSKIYRANPRLCRSDGPVLRVRRWYEQFVPDKGGTAAGDARRCR